MYLKGYILTKDQHFQHHLVQGIPVQIYDELQHSDIGYIERYGAEYVKMNNIYYHRGQYLFISRPGY